MRESLYLRCRHGPLSQLSLHLLQLLCEESVTHLHILHRLVPAQGLLPLQLAQLQREWATGSYGGSQFVQKVRSINDNFSHFTVSSYTISICSSCSPHLSCPALSLSPCPFLTPSIFHPLLPFSSPLSLLLSIPPPSAPPILLLHHPSSPSPQSISIFSTTPSLAHPTTTT